MDTTSIKNQRKIFAIFDMGIQDIGFSSKTPQSVESGSEFPWTAKLNYILPRDSSNHTPLTRTPGNKFKIQNTTFPPCEWIVWVSLDSSKCFLKPQFWSLFMIHRISRTRVISRNYVEIDMKSQFFMLTASSITNQQLRFFWAIRLTIILLLCDYSYEVFSHYIMKAQGYSF